MLYAASFASLIILNIRDVVRSINHQSFDTFSLQISNFLTRNAHRLDTLVPKSVFTFLFWAIVGALVYLVLWIVIALITSYTDNAALVSRYIFPTQTKREDVLHAVLFRVAVRVVAFGALFFWLVLFINGLLPVTATMIMDAVSSANLKSILLIFVALTVVATSFYVCMTLLRFGLLRRRILNR